VKSIKVGNKTLEGTDVRTILNLNSANFTIEFSKTNVAINVLGNGHGVGMSQWGADVMAASGKKYDEILKHYYQGIEICKIEDVYKR
jgi:stage II sporulation protein D